MAAPPPLPSLARLPQVSGNGGAGVRLAEGHRCRPAKRRRRAAAKGKPRLWSTH